MKVGDTVEMVSMFNDPNPIPTGTKGVLKSINRVNMKPIFTQYDVKWENGRTLMVVSPPDVIRVVS